MQEPAATAPGAASGGAAGSRVWVKRFGDDQLRGTCGDFSNGIAVDSDGSVVLISNGQWPIDFGGGPLVGVNGWDVRVAKLDANGHHLWSTVFGGQLAQYGYAVAIGPGGDIVIAGGFDGTIDLGGGALSAHGFDDIWVAKLSADGDHIWSKQFSSFDMEAAYAVAVDPSGNVLPAGYLFGPVDLGGGPLTPTTAEMDMFVAKLDPAGNHLWSKRFGNTGQDLATAVVSELGEARLQQGRRGQRLSVLRNRSRGRRDWPRPRDRGLRWVMDFGCGPMASSASGADIYLAKLTWPSSSPETRARCFTPKRSSPR
jgi:hypothetical protein